MSQTLKPATAAAKLGIYLPATPEEFQQTPLTRDALDELRANPPAWLIELRRNGPFPRDVVAAKLGVSKSGLVRGGVTAPLTSDDIGELIANPPAWLVHERETHRNVIAEQERLRQSN